MNQIIEEYYTQAKLPTVLLRKKLKKLQVHMDIAKEFEYWIVNKDFNSEDCISIQGYTAESLAKLSPYLNGEGAFMLLIELRENPQKALSQIQEGFKLR